jgi:hypothetical protein
MYAENILTCVILRAAQGNSCLARQLSRAAGMTQRARSTERSILNAYIPTLQMLGAMVTFLREVCGKPMLSPVVFKALTDRFVAAVQAFTAKHRIPVLHATGRTKPGELAQRALRAAARTNRGGVVVVVVHQESARVFASRHAGGASHQLLGAGGAPAGQSRVPFRTLDNCVVEVADPEALSDIAQRFDARLVDQIARGGGRGCRTLSRL